MSDLQSNGFFQIGVVTKKGADGLQPDPAGLGWVCVELGLKSPEPYWMRLVQPYASNKFGFAFYPEIGDQVLTVRIGTGEYLCLGSLYTSKNTAKITNDKGNEYSDNFIKEIRTKQGNAITINDEPDKEYVQIDVKEGKITVKLDYGGKNVLVKCVSDIKNFDVLATEADLKVEVKNATVKVGSAVIEIKSDKIDVKGASLTIKTDGEIAVEAGAGITIKGTSVEIC
jgi:uncharacterized protein involved in type VI secretion and phage assembly